MDPNLPIVESLGGQTACRLSKYWDGAAAGLGYSNRIDGLHLGDVPGFVTATAAEVQEAPSELDDTLEFAGDDADEPNELDGEETTDEEAPADAGALPSIYMPLVQN